MSLLEIAVFLGTVFKVAALMFGAVIFLAGLFDSKSLSNSLKSMLVGIFLWVIFY